MLEETRKENINLKKQEEFFNLIKKNKVNQVGLLMIQYPELKNAVDMVNSLFYNDLYYTRLVKQVYTGPAKGGYSRWSKNYTRDSINKNCDWTLRLRIYLEGSRLI